MNYEKILSSIKAGNTLIIQVNKLSKEVPVLCLLLGDNKCFKAHCFLMSTDVLKLRVKKHWKLRSYYLNKTCCIKNTDLSVIFLQPLRFRSSTLLHNWANVFIEPSAMDWHPRRLSLRRNPPQRREIFSMTGPCVKCRQKDEETHKHKSGLERTYKLQNRVVRLLHTFNIVCLRTSTSVWKSKRSIRCQLLPSSARTFQALETCAHRHRDTTSRYENILQERQCFWILNTLHFQHFIFQVMHTTLKNVELLKHKYGSCSSMFRFTRKPSEGSHSQYLAKIMHLVQSEYVELLQDVVSVMALCEGILYTHRS